MNSVSQRIAIRKILKVTENLKDRIYTFARGLQLVVMKFSRGSQDEDSLSLSPRKPLGILRIDEKSFTIYPGITTIGRHPNSKIQNNDESVSKHHAVIEAWTTNGLMMLKDLNSSNRTKLNGIRLIPRVNYQLKDGDTLGFARISGVLQLFSPLKDCREDRDTPAHPQVKPSVDESDVSLKKDSKEVASFKSVRDASTDSTAQIHDEGSCFRLSKIPDEQSEKISTLKHEKVDESSVPEYCAKMALVATDSIDEKLQSKVSKVQQSGSKAPLETDKICGEKALSWREKIMDEIPLTLEEMLRDVVEEISNESWTEKKMKRSAIVSVVNESRIKAQNDEQRLLPDPKGMTGATKQEKRKINVSPLRNSVRIEMLSQERVFNESGFVKPVYNHIQIEPPSSTSDSSLNKPDSSKRVKLTTKSTQGNGTTIRKQGVDYGKSETQFLLQPKCSSGIDSRREDEATKSYFHAIQDVTSNSILNFKRAQRASKHRLVVTMSGHEDSKTKRFVSNGEGGKNKEDEEEEEDEESEDNTKNGGDERKEEDGENADEEMEEDEENEKDEDMEDSENKEEDIEEYDGNGEEASAEDEDMEKDDRDEEEENEDNEDEDEGENEDDVNDEDNGNEVDSENREDSESEDEEQDGDDGDEEVQDDDEDEEDEEDEEDQKDEEDEEVEASDDQGNESSSSEGDQSMKGSETVSFDNTLRDEIGNQDNSNTCRWRTGNLLDVIGSKFGRQIASRFWNEKLETAAMKNRRAYSKKRSSSSEGVSSS
ncbi:hypothetical protein QAD02_023941 [Eretmocerus hayati]|uniref:Uncharacterized protein n=1 Tax=Eretmocerus hayati TaxID=131215 RepID=A0ACC2PX87_9HYME|nr:hypothetical protein QAD02_023941 [Eretmocerus hayati]